MRGINRIRIFNPFKYAHFETFMSHGTEPYNNESPGRMPMWLQVINTSSQSFPGLMLKKHLMTR